MGANFTRIIADILLFLSMLVLPWQFFVVFAVGLFFWFAPFYEGLAIGLAGDLLYAVPRKIFLGVSATAMETAETGLPVFFIGFLIVFLLSKIIRKQLRVF